MRIVIDLPQPSICLSDIQIQPVQKDLINSPSQQSKFCLSLAILLASYGYLLYLHLYSLYELHYKSLLKELDILDIWITAVSMIRLATLFVFPLINHNSGLIAMDIQAFIWEIVLFVIYLRFIIQGRRNWIYVVSGGLLLYAVIIGAGNYYYHQLHPTQQDMPFTLFIPLFYPQILIDISITAIGVYQFLYIEKALAQRLLTNNIIIQLKNRRSFIFLTVTTCWISLIMRKYPQIFKPILGVVLYFITSQWVNMAIIYRCVLHRIIRSNEESQLSQEEDQRKKRNSGLIVVQMQDYGIRKK